MLRAAGVGAEELFGLVGDVAVAADGTAYVLDVLANQVGVFAPSGERTRVLGREGRGPGELMGPVSIAVDPRGDLLVLDERNQRVESFSGSDGRWLRSFPLDFHPRDLCFVEGRLYVLGARGGRLIHEVSPEDGRVARSFAPDPESSNALLAGYRAGGYLGCGPGDEIAFLPSLRADVVRYSAPSGAVIGTARIPEHRGVRVTPTADGGMMFDVPDGGRNYYASSIVPLASGDRLIQVGYLQPRSSTDHEFESVRTYLLSAADGEIRPLSDTIPRLMAARGDDFFAAQTTPHPAVAVLRDPPQGVLP